MKNVTTFIGFLLFAWNLEVREKSLQHQKDQPHRDGFSDIFSSLIPQQMTEIRAFKVFEQQHKILSISGK